MPHLVIHCSDSVTQMVTPDALLEAVFEAAESTGLFASEGVGGIKVRLESYEHYRNVDGQEHFVHVFGWIMQGRTAEQKRDLTEVVVGALTALLPRVEIISMNVSDFERASYYNATMIEAPDGTG